MLSFMNTMGMLTLFFVGIFFKFVSVNWFPLVFGNTLICNIAFIILLLVAPETPKWLLLMNRTDDAINSFNRIALINRSK